MSRICEMCGEVIPVGKLSIDVWAQGVIWYDEDGMVMKTGIDQSYALGAESPDYIVVGEECCGHKFRALWTAFTNQVIQGGGELT